MSNDLYGFQNSDTANCLSTTLPGSLGRPIQILSFNVTFTCEYHRLIQSGVGS